MVIEVATNLIILLFSVIIHEIAHGWVALKCGDPTARDAGRLTLNPLPHIDPFMTLFLPAVLALQSVLLHGPGIIFGGAKPVPVNPYRLRGGQRDHVKVSFAGAGANILLALAAFLLCLPVLVLGRHSPSGLSGAAISLLLRVVQINLILANFNLLPIPPLDGSWILGYFLRGEARRWYASLQARGFQAFLIFMVVAWLVPGLMNLVFFPFRAVYGVLIQILLLVAG